jgi:transposase
VSKPTVIAWKKRYAAAGIAGLEDLPKPGRPAQVDEVAVVLATLEPPPERLGVTHWSSRLLADHLSGQGTAISNVWVARIWRKWGLQPWRRETFKFSTDPQLEAKVRDVVGLYLDPPERAIVVCVDEKRQIQALSRTAPNLPLRPASPERRTHHHTRHGTTTLFAALEVATGRVVDQCVDRHRHGELLAFLQLVAKAYPRRQLHLVLDNYGTHTHAAVKAWLARHPRIHLHFTPTSASWMNLVEVFFSIITRQAIRRGSFPSVPDLIAAIGRFVDGWNQRCQPFVWVNDADDIMIKATRKRTSGTEEVGWVRGWRGSSRSVSSPSPSNRACGSPAHGSPTSFTGGVRPEPARAGSAWERRRFR